MSWSWEEKRASYTHVRTLTETVTFDIDDGVLIDPERGFVISNPWPHNKPGWMHKHFQPPKTFRTISISCDPAQKLDARANPLPPQACSLPLCEIERSLRAHLDNLERRKKLMATLGDPVADIQAWLAKWRDPEVMAKQVALQEQLVKAELARFGL